MFDQTAIANQISQWTNLGIKLEKQLADAIDVFETLYWVEVGRLPIFSVEDVTTANAEKKVYEYAEQLAIAEQVPGSLSVLAKAKKHAVDAAARQVTALARLALPDAIEQLTPGFDAHVDAYAGAVARLPDPLTSDSLVAAGVGALEAYGDAQQAARYLTRIDSWVASIAYLGGVLPKNQDVVLRVLRPDNAIQLAKLEAAHQLKANRAEAALNAVFLAAARLGVDWGINTSREASKLRQDLAIQPQRIDGVATLR